MEDAARLLYDRPGLRTAGDVTRRLEIGRATLYRWMSYPAFKAAYAALVERGKAETMARATAAWEARGW